MLPFRVILGILAIACLTNGRVISYPSSGSGKDQYQKREVKWNTQQDPDESELSQSGDGINEIEHREHNSDLIRILTHQNEIEESEETQDIAASNTLTDNRQKRSFYPYNAEYQWPQLESSNTWGTNKYFVRKPLFSIPVKVPKKNSKYNYYDNVDAQPKSARSSRKVTVNQLMAPDNAEVEISENNPVWDISAYHNAKTSRQSRSSKRELTWIYEEASSNELSEENEIQSGRLTIGGLKGPSRCAWAIVSCCSSSTLEVNQNCFREIGCAGPFWDVSPCSKEFTKAAIQNVLYYYNSKF